MVLQQRGQPDTMENNDSSSGMKDIDDQQQQR
jgi:hypothetical protein